MIRVVSIIFNVIGMLCLDQEAAVTFERDGEIQSMFLVMLPSPNASYIVQKMLVTVGTPQDCGRLNL